MFERHRIEEENTGHAELYCKTATRGKTEYAAGSCGYWEEATCLCGDGIRARVVTRFKSSNSRRSFERLLGKVKTLQGQLDAEHLLFGMEPTGHYSRDLAHFLGGRGYRFRPWPNDARTGWSTLSP